MRAPHKLLSRVLVFYQRGRLVNAEQSVAVFVHGVHVLLKGIDMFPIMISTPCKAEKGYAQSRDDDKGGKLLW